MYTLRTVTPNGDQLNELIGENYSYVDKEKSYDLFSEIFKDYFDYNHVADLDEKSNNTTVNCHGFLSIKNVPRPLYKTHKYYIMTDSGKTFSNLSY